MSQGADSKAAGNTLVYADADPSNGVAEEKQVTGLAEEDGRTIVTWAPPIATGSTTSALSRWSRKFGLFGATAAPAYPVFEPITSGSTEYKWQVRHLTAADFAIAAGTTQLDLDAQHDAVRVGQRVLVVAPVSGGTLVLRTEVTGAALANVTFAGIL